MNTFKNIIIKYRTNGLKYIVNRFIHKIFSLINIYWENYYLLNQKIDITNVEKYLDDNINIANVYKPIKLEIFDFELGDKVIFNKSKLDVIKDRFNNQDIYIPYGIKLDNTLVYSCWICFKDIIFPFNTHYKLDEDALFLDDYCHPNFRGKGIHTYMNFYRLKELHKLGFQNVSVLIQTNNKPALKSQIKAGFQVKTKFLFLKFGKKIIIKPYK